MTPREQRRGWVLTRVVKGELAMSEAAETVGPSERQLWRMRVAFGRSSQKNDQERDPQGDKREKNPRENAKLHAGKVDGARDPWQGVGRLLGL